MKPPKSEPYQRSRHRAALHAWVVAATAVASVGMPSAAVALDRRAEDAAREQADITPSQAAQRVAADWLNALCGGDRDAALSSIRLPREAENERAVLEDIRALSDWMRQSEVEAQPIAHRHAGHWALSAWRLDVSGNAAEAGGFIEPIMLYNPAADGLFDNASDWQIVPQGVKDDPALAPLYNIDHDSLLAWSDTLL